ncbi:hypothetical protein ACFPYI_07525 [Halomarina salina]|uniref:DUF7344 domain-containing protein n=1 Tax=Halomarina salina TaxID=1872699 RepID=A0ABD5RKY8_9EURY|nr:hypothetical protein [Halomarina salina]
MTYEVSADTALALLGTKTRRQVVALLLEVDETWSVEGLAAELVRLDPAVAPDGTDAEAHTERVATRLYHCALPKLADADAVEFDSEEMTVAPGEQLPRLGARLDDLLDLPNTGSVSIEPTASV